MRLRRRARAFSHLPGLFNGDAILGADRLEPPKVGPAGGGSRVQFTEHLIEAATRRAEDKHASRVVAGVAHGMALAACAEEEPARPMWRGAGSPANSISSSPLST